jgi:hypothetical protein
MKLRASAGHADRSAVARGNSDDILLWLGDHFYNKIILSGIMQMIKKQK